MKIAAVGNPNILLGLALAGIKKICETKDPEKALTFIDEVILTDEYGLVIITPDLYLKLEKELVTRREKHRLPLYVEFPLPGLFDEREINEHK